jgi:D-alanine transaminase
MEALANINGTQMPLAEVRIPAQDRGFLFGDAVYEVLRVYQGKAWLADRHFERFRHSLGAIRISGVDVDRLQRRMKETIAAGPFSEALVYIQVTRGSAPRAHAFPIGIQPLELLYVQEFHDSYAEARQRGGAVITHPDLRWARCDVKSTNLLGNVLAMQAAKEAGCLEALLYDSNGILKEGSHSSLFWIHGRILHTTPKSNAILPGITRDFVLGLAAQQCIPVHEADLNRSNLWQVDELFLSGTTAEVLPVISVDGKTLGNGQVGAVTRQLQYAYMAAVKDFVS